MTTGLGPAYGKFRLNDSELDGDNPRPRKRNRKTLSCIQCHRSKVKCDRETPCNRCTKAGRAVECTYGVDAPGPNGQDEPRRGPPSQSFASAIHMNTGLTNWATLIGELGDVKRYVFNQDADFHEAYDRVTALKNLYPTPSSHNFPFGDNHLDTSTLAQGAILGHLPPRTIVLDLVDNYMATYEKTHRLLHAPQFQRELVEFYAAPLDVPANWVAQLLMMLCLSAKSAPQSLKDMVEGSTQNSISRNFPQWAEAFLRQSPYVNLPDLCSVRTLCMMAIAKGLIVDTPAHSRGLWGLVGFIVRLAMTMVLHRDPSSYPELSTYEVEMRRRVWATVMFLDLDAAIESGLPPSIRPGDSDTAIPLNINDAQLSISPSQIQTNSTLMALSQPRNNWTDSTIQIRLAESYPIVSKVLSIANSTKPDIDSQTVENCDRKLRDILRGTNGIFAHLLGVLPDMEKVLVLQQTMFEVFIRRILLALHHACVRDARYSPVYELSHVSILECSLALLYAQQTLQEKRERQPSMIWFADRYQADFSVAMLHVIIGLRRNEFPEAAEPADIIDAQHLQQVPRIQARETTLTALRASHSIMEAGVGRSFHILRMYFGMTLSIAAFEAAERGEPLPDAMQEAAERIIEVAKRQRKLSDHNCS